MVAGVGSLRPARLVQAARGVAMTLDPASKILMAHCYYRERGGEDASFEAEVAMLTSHSHPVATYTRTSREIDGYNLLQRFRLPARAIWATDTRRSLDSMLL